MSEWMISVDDHLIEPPGVWVDRLPAKHRDCVQAYDDWLIDEWCATAPGRFIPLALVPIWDGRLAGVPDDVRWKVLRGNAERVFSFTPDEP